MAHLDQAGRFAISFADVAIVAQDLHHLSREAQNQSTELKGYAFSRVLSFHESTCLQTLEDYANFRSLR